MKQPRFDLYQDKAGEWRWRLVAKNGRTIADSGEGYATKGGAERAIDTVVATATLAKATTRMVEDASILSARPDRNVH